MKNKSAGFYSSSLEMLLDTMCNMLGGVVFIALMVAVVAKDSVTRQPEQAQAQSSALSQELAALSSSNSVAAAELEALSRRLQDPAVQPKTNTMRLPNLSGTAKQPWVVIAQHGKLYPLDVFAGAEHAPVLNAQEVRFDTRSRYAEARAEAGQPPEAGVKQMLEAFKAAGRTNYYFTFLVYEDSFGAFVKAREAAAAAGMQYGWTPLPRNQRIQFGTQGERVLPQN